MQCNKKIVTILNEAEVPSEDVVSPPFVFLTLVKSWCGLISRLLLRTVGIGKQLLHLWLKQPLIDLSEIHTRLDSMWWINCVACLLIIQCGGTNMWIICMHGYHLLKNVLAIKDE